MKKIFTAATDLSGASPQKSDDVLVRVENVSKKFCRDLKRSLWYGMKDLSSELLCRRHDDDEVELRKDEFWAVKDVSFELKRGECLGLIGRNGAGKTTLLRMLNGLIKPDRGRIEMRGRVGALIALGAGFNPILTGRENIYINAAVLGLNKKETDEKFDEIIEFAELGEFIDTPVQSYSSGMQVRLGFAVAAVLNPDVLLLDEVLAVGDTRFRAKCLKSIKAVRNRGGGIVLVTHILEQVAHYCDRAVLVDSGKLIVEGRTSEVLEHYIHNIVSKPTSYTNVTNTTMLSESKKKQIQGHENHNLGETRWGDRSAIITDMVLMQNKRKCSLSIFAGIETELIFNVRFNNFINEPIYGLSIKSDDGVIIFNTNSRQLLGPAGVPTQKKGDSLTVCFGFMPVLDTGKYFISLGVASDTPEGVLAHDRRYDCICIEVITPFSITGDIALNPEFHIISNKKNDDLYS